MFPYNTENYSTKPPSTKSPISRHPRDSRGCHSVTWACPNASNACLMLLRYERRTRQEVNVWLSDMRVNGFGCGPWRWYRGVGDIHMNRGN
jgi:hypothetical protein